MSADDRVEAEADGSARHLEQTVENDRPPAKRVEPHHADCTSSRRQRIRRKRSSQTEKRSQRRRNGEGIELTGNLDCLRRAQRGRVRRSPDRRAARGWRGSACAGCGLGCRPQVGTVWVRLDGRREHHSHFRCSRLSSCRTHAAALRAARARTSSPFRLRFLRFSVCESSPFPPSPPRTPLPRRGRTWYLILLARRAAPPHRHS